MSRTPTRRSDAQRPPREARSAAARSSCASAGRASPPVACSRPARLDLASRARTRSGRPARASAAPRRAAGSTTRPVPARAPRSGVVPGLRHRQADRRAPGPRRGRGQRPRPRHGQAYPDDGTSLLRARPAETLQRGRNRVEVFEVNGGRDCSHPGPIRPFDDRLTPPGPRGRPRSPCGVGVARRRRRRRAAVPDPPLTDADYFAFADEVMGRLERTWSARTRCYSAGGRAIDTIYNAAMLRCSPPPPPHGHEGPRATTSGRGSCRARLASRRRSSPAPTLPRPRQDVPHARAGLANMARSTTSTMDKSIDPKVAEGLRRLAGARRCSASDPSDGGAIVASSHAVARGPFFRYPHVRLNQINWNAELYAYDAALTGDPDAAASTTTGAHLHRFVAGVRRPWTRGRRAQPRRRATASTTSPTRAGSRTQPRLRRVREHHAALPVSFTTRRCAPGCGRCREADMRLLRAWAQRVAVRLLDARRHAQLGQRAGLERWMKAKTWAYAQQGLLAIATAPRFHRDPRHGPLGEVPLRPRAAAATTHLGDRAPRHPSRPSAATTVGIGDQGARRRACSWPGWRQRGARRVGRGLGPMPAERAAAVLRLRRRHRAAGRVHAALLAPPPGRQPRRVPLRRGGARAPLRRRRRPDRHDRRRARRPPSASWSRARAGASVRHAARPAPRPIAAAARADPLAARSRQPPAAPRTRPDAGPFQQLDETSTRTGDGFRITTFHAFRRNTITLRYTICARVGPGSAGSGCCCRPPAGPTAASRRCCAAGAAVAGDRAVDPSELQDVVAFDLRSPARLLPGGDQGYRARHPRRLRAARRPPPTRAAGRRSGLELPPMRRGVRRLELQLLPSSGGGTLQDPAAPPVADPTATPSPDAVATP